MYAHTHVFFLNKKDVNPSSLSVVGSIIPDIALMGFVGWDVLHRKDIIEKFQGFISRTVPKLADLGDGIMSHFVVDEMSHNKYKDDIGYAYINITPELVKLT